MNSRSIGVRSGADSVKKAPANCSEWCVKAALHFTWRDARVQTPKDGKERATLTIEAVIRPSAFTIINQSHTIHCTRRNAIHALYQHASTAKGKCEHDQMSS